MPSLAEALADLFDLHGHAVSADAALEGRTGEVHTVPILAEKDGAARVVQLHLDGRLVSADRVASALALLDELGADQAILVHLGPVDPDAFEAAGDRVVLWGQDVLARLLGEAIIAREVDGEPSPLPLTNEVPEAPALAESVSDLMPAAFREPVRASRSLHGRNPPPPTDQAAEPVAMPDFMGALTAEPETLQVEDEDEAAGIPEVIAIPLPGAPDNVPVLGAAAVAPPPAPPAYAPAPAYAPPAAPAMPAFSPAPVPTYLPAVPAVPAFDAAPVFAPAFAPAAAAYAPAVMAPAFMAPPTPPAPAFTTPATHELDPLPFFPPTPGSPAAAQAPMKVNKPAGPLMGSVGAVPMLPVRVTVEEATRKVKDRLYGVERHELILQPVHLFDYECDLLAEGSLRTDTVDGRLQVHGTDKSCTLLDPDQANPQGPTLLASTLGLQVIDKVLRVTEERARQLATEFVVKTHTRLVDVQVKDTDGRFFYTEKRKVAPQPDHVRLHPIGVMHRAVWRLWGTNGNVDVDALDGRLLEQQLRNANSDSMLVD